MIVLDDFLNKKDFDVLQNFIESMDFPWFYVSNVSLPPGANFQDQQAKETFGFNHTVYNYEDGTPSFFFQSMPIILTTFEEKYNKKIKKLLRIRLGMKHPKLGFTQENYNLPHVDYHFPHATLIYYINKTDGDTFIFEQEFTEEAGEPDNFSVAARVNPIPNRMLYLENGLQYHTASNPIDHDRRIVLNINLIT